MIPRFLGLALLCLAAAAPGRVHAQIVVRSASVAIVVHVPADAAVFFDGHLTQITGPDRIFTTPLLELGGTYGYDLKFAWQGKEIVRRVNVIPGEIITLEVRPEDFQSAREPAEKPAVKKTPEESLGVKEPKEKPAVKKTPEESLGVKEPKEKLAVKIAPEESQGVKEPKEKPAAPIAPPARRGFVVKFLEDRWWIFREGSKEAADVEKHGPPEKHVTRLNVPPWKITLKAPDAETLLGYVAAQDGFETFVVDGRIWAFKTGSKYLAEFQKHHELEKHVTRINAGPLGMTVKAPDVATLEAYLKGFQPQQK